MDHIKFKDIKGGHDRDDLEGCYFAEIPPGSGEFYLFAADNSPIETEPSPVTNNTPFTFTTYRKLSWALTMDYSDEKQHGHGKWSAQHGKSVGKARPSISDDDPESGTFQLQNGPGAGEDLSASASASA